MTLHLDSRSLALFFVRLSLALYVGAAGLALLTGNIGGTNPVWLPLDTFSSVAPVLGVVFVAAAALLLAGRATTAAATATATLLIAILVAWLIANPLHNTMNHLMPFMAAALVTLAFARDRRGFDEATRVALVLLFSRLFVGSIFVAQGTRSMTRGLVTFARKLYVAPLADSWIPEPLLWIAGLTNPIIQVTTGVLLMLGLRTRFAASLMAAFLVTIFFGHLLKDPFDRGVSPHAYAMANFLVAIVVLWLHPRGDRFSLDAMLARRRGGAAMTSVAAAAHPGGVLERGGAASDSPRAECR